ncbi:MAG: bifunctional riboflavin kinase/FAD synthetase [Eubacteriales bacterium]|nr:bifunctional riboflavin kinase/FAD synthetase [Eubacteriales bacterium]
MKVFRNRNELKNLKPSAIALGNFDGIHKGHQTLIGACIESAKSLDLVSSVFTFSNHPTNVIAGETVIRNIITFDEKAHILEKMGIDCLFSFAFDQSIRTSTPDDFCRDLLFGALKMKEAFCGFNYHFGYKAKGNPDTLRQIGTELGYGVTVLPPVEIEGEVVSSTLIRKAVDEGNLDRYRLFTGRRYALVGHVIEGRRFGRTLGFPTINLALDLSMALPPNGVYLTRTIVERKHYDSITNVGQKPTVGLFAKNAETHIFDFDRDIYGMDVRVQFIELLREERTFSSIEQLTVQIENDCITARRLHQERRRNRHEIC